MSRIGIWQRGRLVAWAVVDDDIYGLLGHRRLNLDKDGYVILPGRPAMRLHRLILRLRVGDPREGDHRNGNKLDNRRSNLRIATRRQNAQNVPAKPGSRSRYRGVGYDASRRSAKRWRARVSGKQGAHIGWFLTEDEAGTAVLAWLAENAPYAELDRCVSHKVGQVAIFHEPPGRRLIVPEGATAWWGVDCSTKRVAIATIAADGRRGVTMASFPSGAGGERLAAIFSATRQLAADLAADLMPGVVLVEQPSGKTPNPALSYAVGAIMAAVYEGVRRVSGVRVAVETISSSQWKKTATGGGNAYKPKSGKIEEYAVYTWAVSAGYRGRSFDEVDAWGIAEHARRTIALECR